MPVFMLRAFCVFDAKVGVGARLVYEFEAERRNAPQHFTSRKANNCMFVNAREKCCPIFVCVICIECFCSRQRGGALFQVHEQVASSLLSYLQGKFGMQPRIPQSPSIDARP